MIEYHKQAKKFILSQEKFTAARLFRAIERIPLGDIMRLKGKDKPPLYRLRVGNYRVVFYEDQDNIIILRVDNRGDIYKRL